MSWLLKSITRAKKETSTDYVAQVGERLNDVNPNRSRVLVGAEMQQSVANAEPWFTSSSIAWLENQDFSKKRILEYGGGGSTLWWLRRSREVFTVEASYIWTLALLSEVSEDPALMARWRLMFVNCDWRYRSATDIKWRGPWREHNSVLTPSSIVEMENAYYADVCPQPDVVVIDGQFRARTVKHILHRVSSMRPDLIVIDNTEHNATDSAIEANQPRDYTRLDFPEASRARIPEDRAELVTSCLIRNGSSFSA